MSFLLIYIVLAVTWSIFAAYKNWQINKSSWWIGLIINLLVFPISVGFWIWRIKNPKKSSCQIKQKPVQQQEPVPVQHLTELIEEINLN